jgi:hypothetical protein
MCFLSGYINFMPSEDNGSMPVSKRSSALNSSEAGDIRTVFLFSISFKVMREEMAKWKWDSVTQLSRALFGCFIIIYANNKAIEHFRDVPDPPVYPLSQIGESKLID